jgi:glycosyltransferase involved in cell wall biosynthesis
MRGLKVAVFSDSASPVANGVSVSIDTLIAALRRRGHSVHLYTSRFPGHVDSDPNVHRFPSIRSPWTGDYPLAVPPFYPWFAEFKRQGFDIVHTHTPFTVGFVGLRWAESTETPIVATYHTHYDKYVHYMPFFPRRYLRYKVAKHTHFYYNSVDHVVTPSEASRRWLLRHSVSTPVSVIPTGVPEPKMFDRSEVRSQFGADPDTRVLLYAGRIAVEKNIRLILEAAQTVLSLRRSCVLWIVGDGPARAAFTEEARLLGIGDRTVFWGSVPRHDVDRFYAAADVFLFASMTETQGLVVTEAMTYGLPAVVVQGGGASQAVTDGVSGFIVPNNPDDMASHVLRLLDDDTLAASVSRAARHDGLNLTVGAMAGKIETLYHQVVGHSDRTGAVSVH